MPLPLIQNGVYASVEHTMTELKKNQPNYVHAAFKKIFTRDPLLGGFILGCQEAVKNNQGVEAADQALEVVVWVIRLLESQAEADDMAKILQ